MSKLLFGFVFICQIIFIIPAFAEDGVRIGDTWTDEAGNNYKGDPSSASSYSGSSSYSSGYSGYDRLGEAVSQALSNWAEMQSRYSQGYTLTSQGDKFLGQGDSEQAIAYYEQALGYLPENRAILEKLNRARAGSLNKKGKEYHKQGDWANAVAAYQQALGYNPNSRDIRQNLRMAEKGQSYEQIRQKEWYLKQQMAQASQELMQKAEAITRDLAPPPGTSIPGFKPAEAPKAGYEGDHQIAHKDELAFKNMNPEKPTGELEDRTLPAITGSKTTKGGLKSVEFHSIDAKNAPSEVGAKGKAGIGFDTAGIPGDELPNSKAVQVPEVVGVPLVEVLPPPVPEEKRTPAIEKYETERGELFTKRKEIETKAAEMEKAEKPNTVEIVKLKDEATQIKNKENFLSFQITEDLAKAPEVKTEGSKPKKQ